MKIALHMVKSLADHTVKELDSLEQRTILEEHGNSSMWNEIQDVRAQSSTNKTLMVYHFRDTNGVDIGWVTILKRHPPYQYDYDELWTFVVPQFRRQGVGSEMVKVVTSMFSPEQKARRIRVFGSHSNKARSFYNKQIGLYGAQMWMGQHW